jgi:hypothetical protein
VYINVFFGLVFRICPLEQCSLPETTLFSITDIFGIQKFVLLILRHIPTLFSPFWGRTEVFKVELSFIYRGIYLTCSYPCLMLTLHMKCVLALYILFHCRHSLFFPKPAALPNLVACFTLSPSHKLRSRWRTYCTTSKVVHTCGL